MLAGGIGVTPLLAMLRHIVYEGWRTRNFHPTWFVYGARTKAERAFDGEIAALVGSSCNAVALTRALSDVSSSATDDFEIAGRVTMDLLRGIGPLDHLDFYICGPRGFTQDLYDGLCEAGVPDNQIFIEEFGVASLLRKRDVNANDRMLAAPARRAVDVKFAASGKSARWTPGSGTLLEFAEAQGSRPRSIVAVGPAAPARPNPRWCSRV